MRHGHCVPPNFPFTCVLKPQEQMNQVFLLIIDWFYSISTSRRTTVKNGIHQKTPTTQAKVSFTGRAEVPDSLGPGVWLPSLLPTSCPLSP